MTMVVVGMGITGRAVATAVRSRDGDVVGLDDNAGVELNEWAARTGIAVRPITDTALEEVLRHAEAMIPAPGLPDHHPAFDAARRVGVPIMSEFDLAARWDTRPTIAVTGTDGKTTVVTLVERMLEQSGIPAMAVGNTDTPWVEAIENPRPQFFVVEASSFRLGHSQAFAPTISAWLNFGPDHLDAHRDLAAYERAKASIWDHLAPDAVVIANRQDRVVMRHAEQVRTARVETFGLDEPPTDSDHGVAADSLVCHGAPIIGIEELPRSLPHDLANALAAAACALAAGASRAAVAHVLGEFEGLEHRVQFVAEIDGVRYVNDSKATTPHAAAAALGGFDSVVLLAGGKNKGLAFDDMIEHTDRIRHVVALGDAAADIEAAFAGQVPTTTATSMEMAIDQAAAVAEPGDVVLLSPACASYDWYRSYVHRGEDFIRLVRDRQSSKDTP